MNLQATRKQLDFIHADADEVLFGGAAGGGKSYAQLIDALLYALKYPGSKQLILRRTFPDLERSLIMEHLKIYPQKVYRYNASNHRGRFKNGSTVEFGYCDAEKDVYHYQGAEYDTIRFDELTQFTEEQYTYLMSRLRGVNDFPKQMKSTANPGGVGHQWVKNRWVDRMPAYTKTHIDDEKRGIHGNLVYMPSKVTDNVFLMRSDPGYLKRLENLPKAQREALLDGNWDVYEGQYFTEFDREVHVCRPFEIPKHWKRYYTMDYGMDMLAAFVVAVDENGRCFVERETYRPGLIISAAAAAAKEMVNGDKMTAWLAPPDLWNRRQETGKSVADIFGENGIPLTKTSNDRVAGWLAVHEALAVKKQADGTSAAGLQVFENCRNLIRTLPAVQFDAKNPNDVANEPHEITHAPDALRGFCIYWITPAGRKPGAGHKWTADMWEDYRNADAGTRRYLKEKWGEPEV